MRKNDVLSRIVLVLGIILSGTVTASLAATPGPALRGAAGFDRPLAACGENLSADRSGVGCCSGVLCEVCCRADESPVCGLWHCYCRRTGDKPPVDPIIIVLPFPVL